MNTRKCQICGKTIQIQKKIIRTSTQGILYNRRWFCNQCWKKCTTKQDES